MVADNKKQLDSDSTTLSPATYASDSGQASPSQKSQLAIKPKKKYFLIALLFVLILATGSMILKSHLHIGKKIYAQAAGHKIYKDDVQNLIGNTKGISNRQAATVLANQYLTEAMAKEAGVTVTDQDLVSLYGPDISKQKNSNPYAYQSNVNIVYFDKLSAYNAGYYKGELLVANFSSNIAFDSPILDLQKATNPLIGNAEAVAKDKKYAKDFITKLYNQVKSGQITFDQAIQKEHNDPQVGLKAYPTLPHSGPFDTSNVGLGGTALILPESIKPRISKMKAGQLSSPFPVTVNNSLKNKNIKTESYYLVVRMDSNLGGHSGLTYDQYLAQSKKDLGYKVYV